MCNSIMEMEAEFYLFSVSGLFDVVDTLIEFNSRLGKARMDSRLQSI